jgi:hypothetical protein
MSKQDINAQYDSDSNVSRLWSKVRLLGLESAMALRLINCSGGGSAFEAGKW